MKTTIILPSPSLCQIEKYYPSFQLCPITVLLFLCLTFPCILWPSFLVGSLRPLSKLALSLRTCLPTSSPLVMLCPGGSHSLPPPHLNHCTICEICELVFSFLCWSTGSWCFPVCWSRKTHRHLESSMSIPDHIMFPLKVLLPCVPPEDGILELLWNPLPPSFLTISPPSSSVGFPPKCFWNFSSTLFWTLIPSSL